MLRRRKAASLTEVSLLVGLISIVLLSVLSGVGDNLARIFSVTNLALSGNLTSGEGTSDEDVPDEEDVYHSCKELSDAKLLSGAGVYQIKPNGTDEISVYCVGASTMIVAQFETDPVSNWNEGIQEDYDPTLASGRSFALNSNQIPPHSNVLFGQNFTAPYCVQMTYTTGDLDNSVHSGCSVMNKYYVFRSSTGWYDDYNPDADYNVANDSVRLNTLTLEFHTQSDVRQTESDYTWAFAPGTGGTAYRGYAYSGSNLSATVQSGTAWTVFVR